MNGLGRLGRKGHGMGYGSIGGRMRQIGKKKGQVGKKGRRRVGWIGGGGQLGQEWEIEYIKWYIL